MYIIITGTLWKKLNAPLEETMLNGLQQRQPSNSPVLRLLRYRALKAGYNVFIFEFFCVQDSIDVNVVYINQSILKSCMYKVFIIMNKVTALRSRSFVLKMHFSLLDLGNDHAPFWLLRQNIINRVWCSFSVDTWMRSRVALCGGFTLMDIWTPPWCKLHSNLLQMHQFEMM